MSFIERGGCRGRQISRGGRKSGGKSALDGVPSVEAGFPDCSCGYAAVTWSTGMSAGEHGAASFEESIGTRASRSSAAAPLSSDAEASSATRAPATAAAADIPCGAFDRAQVDAPPAVCTRKAIISASTGTLRWRIRMMRLMAPCTRDRRVGSRGRIAACSHGAR